MDKRKGLVCLWMLFFSLVLLTSLDVRADFGIEEAQQEKRISGSVKAEVAVLADGRAEEAAEGTAVASSLAAEDGEHTQEEPQQIYVNTESPWQSFVNLQFEIKVIIGLVIAIVVSCIVLMKIMWNNREED